MRPAVAVGVTAVLFGLVVVAQRGLAGLLNLNYAFVTLVGVLALVQGLRFANESRSTVRRAVETADVEERYESPVPGDDLDRLVTEGSHTSIKRRREFHGRLVDTARETLRARGDYPTAEAADEAVERGTWTDDPVAAWFLGSDERLSPPLSVRIRGTFGSDAEFRFAATRTIGALAAVRAGERSGAAGESPVSGRAAAVSAVRDAGRRRLRALRRRIPGVGR